MPGTAVHKSCDIKSLKFADQAMMAPSQSSALF